MARMFEYFAAEYGWTHDYILDHLTPSQFRLYSELLLCRIDDDKMERQELAIMAAGGNVKEFRKNRRSLRDTLKGKDKKQTDTPTTSSEDAREWIKKMGFGV